MRRSGLILSVGSLAMHGHLQSPLYPNPYPANLHKQWDLEVPSGYQLQISFNYLDIEPSVNCYYDYLMVLHSKKILGKFCGRNSTDPHHPGNKNIVSPSNRLQVVFVTDETNSENHLGFSAFYQAIDIDECSSTSLDPDSRCSQICLNTLGSYLCTCYHGYHLRGDQRTCVLDCGGGVFKELEGGLSSPGYPNSAPLGQNCLYTISVPPGFQITLNFSENFQIEHIQHQEPVCLFHWLKVSVPGETPKKFCGNKSPGIITTNSHLVDLEFHTDGAGESRGFSLRYTTNRVECKLERKITNGKITPNFPKYFYRDYIYIRCDNGYKLMMEGKEISSFKTMCQEDGRWHLSLPQCQIIDCGEPKDLRNGGINFLSGSGNEYKSVIQYHCNEPFYTFNQANKVSFTCTLNRKWKAEGNDIEEIPNCYPVCGRRNVSLSVSGRVFGGELAEKGMFPWQVFLITHGRGGAIVVGEKWILTAAHNLEKSSKERVKSYVGSNIVTELLKSEPLPVESLHVHPEFKISDFNNDIALIKLQSPITFNENVMPVCLPEQDGQSGNMGTVSGFGLTEEQNTADALRYVRLPIVDQQVCHESLNKARQIVPNVYPLTENMFCAGLPEGGNDTCRGDSGSALVIKNNDVFHVAGIVSWGVDCGKPGRYGVYTRVTQYTDWIRKTMEEN
ncbi:complement C1r subcomponent-like isoform X2 [Trichomycterus rosablanca]|uniref:complement C1r subcomponent-like isoform X2 n=1 Tax=Trichomycterus rosablanca TaxID=2290929 RepID=UPI002F356B9E